MSQSPTAAPVRDVLVTSYSKYADRVAADDGRTRLTYAELGARARRVAAGLGELGCVREDRVGIISPNRVEWFEVDHACILGGFARVSPIPRLHPREIRQILADADPKVIFVDSDWLSAAGQDWCPDSVQHVIPFGDRNGTVADIIGPDEPVELERPPADTRSCLTYTSGSTGLPKGVVWTQRSVGAILRNVLAEMGSVSSADVALHTAPLTHFSGAVALAMFAIGAVNVTRPNFDREQVVELVDGGAVTVLPLVPTQINMFTEYLAQREETGAPVDVSRLRQLLYVGSAIAPDQLATALRLLGPIFLQFYGSTESPMPLTALAPEDHAVALEPGWTALLASAGRPTRFIELAILDAEGNRAKAGEVGEIVARGDQEMLEYWRNPAETAATRDSAGWIHTGDLGYLDENDYLFIVDRKKDMIVTGGFNVYPREVENAISTLPDVDEVAVVAAPSQKWGEEITAVIAPRPGAGVSAEQVIAHCRDLIAGYKVPKRVEFVDELPKTGTGKIMKPAIRDRLWSNRTRRV